MSGAIRPLPQYALMAWCSVKAQGQLYLLVIKNIDVIEGEVYEEWSLLRTVEEKNINT
jgi:hypothetical protein